LQLAALVTLLGSCHCQKSWVFSESIRTWDQYKHCEKCFNFFPLFPIEAFISFTWCLLLFSYILIDFIMTFFFLQY
jgi:hypothetical protein